MSLKNFIPRMCAACALIGLLAASISAQELRPRVATMTGTDVRGVVRLENEPTIISLAPERKGEADGLLAPGLNISGLNFVLMNAIEERLGRPYHLGSEGPYRYDCSGFVWSVFQEAGVSFERTSARTLWSQFEPADATERFEFGTLVFFNNLNHVGIVADANGFYHASTSRGVVYSPFNEYWTRRIVGFRKVSLGDNAGAAGYSAMNSLTR